MSGPTPTGEAEAERVFGLLLFDAEEALARGNPEKALVLASRAARERPESLIARSLFERTRREMTRGKRRERLEARVVEARGLLDRGDVAGAEKIVATVLKLLPDHARALELFGVLKERRLGSGSAEAEAERELEAMMRARARRAAEQARAAIDAGWSFRALITVRRALAMIPDDPDLLALYAQSLRQVDKTAGQRAIRRAAHARVLAAQGRMSSGEAAEAVRILRGVLKEDPGNPEARDALATMEQVAATAPARVADPPPGVITGRFTHRKDGVAAPVAAGSVAPPAAATRTPDPPPRAAAPRPRAPNAADPRATWAIAAAAVALTCGVGYVAMTREAPAAVEAPPAVEAPRDVNPSPLALAGPTGDEPASVPPLPGADPALARAVAETLARYGRALEAVDARLLAEARPDLGPHERRAILVRYEGAANVATDLRVQGVVRRGAQATVSVLRTDVIAGRTEATPPVAETLRFKREGGAWVLRPGR